MLEDRFGNVFKVSNTLTEQASSELLIKPSDKEVLQELADDLENCEITLQATRRPGWINNEHNLVRTLEGRHVFVRSRWQ